MTQEQLSEASGVRRDYIGNLERGAISIPREPDQLKLLAKSLGVTLRDLAEPTGWYEDEPAPKDALSPTEAAVLATFRALLREQGEQDDPDRRQSEAAASGS